MTWPVVYDVYMVCHYNSFDMKLRIRSYEILFVEQNTCKKR